MPVHPEDREAVRQAWAHAVQLGSLDVECRSLDHRSGVYRWFRTRAMPVRDGHGANVEWLGT